jgi:NADH-quinone oxidoreductase subunit C
MVVQALTGRDLAERLEQALADSVEEWSDSAVWVRPDRIAEVARFLHDDPALDFQMLNSVTAVDFIEYFEVIYHLTSLRRQQTAIVKAKVYGRESPSLPSVYHIWRGPIFRNGKSGT